jgi:hypothetical protein
MVRGTEHAPSAGALSSGIGTLYTQTGQQEQVHTALSAAIDLYRAMDMTFWLPQAEATLAQVDRSR